MKIVFIIPILGGGGAEIMLGAICEELINQNHHVKLICLQPHHPTFENFPNKEFILHELKPVIIQSKVTFSLFRKTTIDNTEFLSIIDEFRPDIIHSHLYNSELIAYSTIRRNICYFSHAHDNMRQLRRFSWRFLLNKKDFTDYYESRWLKRRYQKANASFIAISGNSQNFLKRNLPSFFDTRIHLLHNAIRLDRFYSKESKNNKIQLISVGNLVPKKNHTLIIDVASELRRRKIPFDVHILGYGMLKSELLNKIDNEDLNDSVHLHGNVKNVEDYLSNSDIYLHTALEEPFGLVLVEAMAAGLPIVCTNGGGNSDLIVEDYNGFLVNEFDAELLADKIEFLIKNPEKSLEMGRNAQVFSKQFDISTYVRNLVHLYSNEIDRNKTC